MSSQSLHLSSSVTSPDIVSSRFHPGKQQNWSFVTFAIEPSAINRTQLLRFVAKDPNKRVVVLDCDCLINHGLSLELTNPLLYSEVVLFRHLISNEENSEKQNDLTYDSIPRDLFARLTVSKLVTDREKGIQTKTEKETETETEIQTTSNVVPQPQARAGRKRSNSHATTLPAQKIIVEEKKPIKKPKRTKRDTKGNRNNEEPDVYYIISELKTYQDLYYLRKVNVLIDGWIFLSFKSKTPSDTKKPVKGKQATSLSQKKKTAVSCTLNEKESFNTKEADVSTILGKFSNDITDLKLKNEVKRIISQIFIIEIKEIECNDSSMNLISDAIIQKMKAYVELLKKYILWLKSCNIPNFSYNQNTENFDRFNEKIVNLCDNENIMSFLGLLSAFLLDYKSNNLQEENVRLENHISQKFTSLFTREQIDCSKEENNESQIAKKFNVFDLLSKHELLYPKQSFFSMILNEESNIINSFSSFLQTRTFEDKNQIETFNKSFFHQLILKISEFENVFFEIFPNTEFNLFQRSLIEIIPNFFRSQRFLEELFSDKVYFLTQNENHGGNGFVSYERNPATTIQTNQWIPLIRHCSFNENDKKIIDKNANKIKTVRNLNFWYENVYLKTHPTGIERNGSSESEKRLSDVDENGYSKELCYDLDEQQLCFCETVKTVSLSDNNTISLITYHDYDENDPLTSTIIDSKNSRVLFNCSFGIFVLHSHLYSYFESEKKSPTVTDSELCSQFKTDVRFSLTFYNEYFNMFIEKCVTSPTKTIFSTKKGLCITLCDSSYVDFSFPSKNNDIEEHRIVKRDGTIVIYRKDGIQTIKKNGTTIFFDKEKSNWISITLEGIKHKRSKKGNVKSIEKIGIAKFTNPETNEVTIVREDMLSFVQHQTGDSILTFSDGTTIEVNGEGQTTIKKDRFPTVELSEKGEMEVVFSEANLNIELKDDGFYFNIGSQSSMRIRPDEIAVCQSGSESMNSESENYCSFDLKKGSMKIPKVSQNGLFVNFKEEFVYDFGERKIIKPSRSNESLSSSEESSDSEEPKEKTEESSEDVIIHQPSLFAIRKNQFALEFLSDDSVLRNHEKDLIFRKQSLTETSLELIIVFSLLSLTSSNAIFSFRHFIKFNQLDSDQFSSILETVEQIDQDLTEEQTDEMLQKKKEFAQEMSDFITESFEKAKSTISSSTVQTINFVADGSHLKEPKPSKGNLRVLGYNSSKYSFPFHHKQITHSSEPSLMKYEQPHCFFDCEEGKPFRERLISEDLEKVEQKRRLQNEQTQKALKQNLGKKYTNIEPPPIISH